MAQSNAGSWSTPILAKEGVTWSNSEVTLLERALQGTADSYRSEVLLSLINAGYRPSEETFFIVALFGKLKEVASDVPKQLASSKQEFESMVDSVADSVALQKEAFEGFTLKVQRIQESVSERLKEQAGNLATDYVTAAIVKEETMIRRNISIAIGEEVRKSLSQALEANSDTISQIRTNSAGVLAPAPMITAVSAEPRTLGVPSVKFVSKGGVTINGKSFVPLALAAAVSLFLGIQFGHMFPRPEVASAAIYGRAIASDRRQMPDNVRIWLDTHVQRLGN